MVMRSTVTEYRVINEKTGQKMGYRYLGKTGMKVSVLSYGNWLTADKADEASQKLVTESIKMCFDMGVNFFDTAEIYALGAAETQMGIALKALNVPRKDYVLSTKILKSSWTGVNDTLLSRKHIIEGTRNCLKRLQTDYVDLIYAHRPDYDTPLEETVRAFSWLIDNGLALYWGTSEWTAVRIEQACAIAERLGLHAPVVEQNQYNMFVRERHEKEYMRLFGHRNYGTTIWSPLCSGFLAGKYNDGNLDEGTRGAMMKDHANPIMKMFVEKWFGPNEKEATVKRLGALAEAAKGFGCSQA